MSNKLYVGNLAYSVSETDLSNIFSECGEVTSINFITDRDTGQSKGFAFVEMSKREEALSAIESIDGRKLSGRAMRVNEAKPQTPRNNQRQGSKRFRKY